MGALISTGATRPDLKSPAPKHITKSLATKIVYDRLTPYDKPGSQPCVNLPDQNVRNRLSDRNGVQHPGSRFRTTPHRSTNPTRDLPVRAPLDRISSASEHPATEKIKLTACRASENTKLLY